MSRRLDDDFWQSHTLAATCVSWPLGQATVCGHYRMLDIDALVGAGKGHITIEELAQILTCERCKMKGKIQFTVRAKNHPHSPGYKSTLGY